MEAHALDEWPVAGINDHFKQHVTVQDRAAAARYYRGQYVIDERIIFILDNENNEFNSAYSSWPTRYWILEDDRVALKMMPDPVDHTISLDELGNWLRDRFD